LLLYASLALSAPLLGVVGALASPLLWFGSARRRNVALLITSAAVLVGSQHFAFVEHWLVVVMGMLLPVAAAVGFLIRPSGITVLLLAPGGDKKVGLALALNIASVALSLALVQLFAWNRSEIADLGYALLSIAACTEALNAWALWQYRGGPPVHRALHLALVVAVLGIASQPPVRTGAKSDVTVWWPAHGRQEFATVNDGFGWSNIGQVGELPLLLRKAGYTVALRPDLENVSGSIIVVPVPVRPLRSAEIDALRRAVMAGSRLLLIAEHTNLDGVRDSFNGVLEGTGIKVNFDTTNAVFGDSTVSLSGFLVRANPHVTHNRGASLAVRDPRAMVLLKGGWWHSDIGAPLSPERGYLSDYRLSPGDCLGNLVLAARTRLGRGEVFVWGDGSPFLNQNLAYNSRFILALMSEVGGEDRLPWIAPVSAAVMLLLWVSARRPEIVGIALVVTLALPFRPLSDAPLPVGLAVISDEENNGFDRDAFSPNSVTGLGIALTRAGLVPSIMHWSSLAQQPRIVFVINPQRAITKRYARRLADLASSGSTVVISGAGDNDTFRKLAGFFGAGPEGPPLGSLSGADFTTYSAWRMKISQGQLLKAGDVDVGTVITVGEGRVVLIADSGFFLSRNLEADTEFDAKNLMFVTTLINKP